MADLSKVKVLGTSYDLKDAAARDRLTTAEADIAALETGKQDVINASNKLAASYVSLTKPEGTKLTSTDVQAAVYELESAIESGGTGSVVTVEQQSTAESGYFATYIIKQGGTAVSGPKINIPKDFLVKGASIKTVTKADEPYEGAKVGDKYIDFVINVKEGTATDEHLYLPVNELVDAYQADETSIHMENNTFSVKAVAMDKVTGLEAALALKADDADLQDEIARATAAEALKADKSALKGLAFANTATGTVPSQTISGVKATGDLSGSVAMTITSTSAAASLTKGDFTPAGFITGEAIKGGSINVTLKDADAASAATVNATPYTPTGDVTVTLKNNTVSEITSVGSLPSKEADSWTANIPTVIDTTKFNGGAAATWTGKSWTPAALTAQTQGDFVKKGVKIELDETEPETLNISYVTDTTDTDFFGKAVTDRGTFTADTLAWGTFNGGSAASLDTGFYTAGSAASFTEGEFSQGTLPTMADKTVDVSTAAFSGDEVANMKVTGVTYMKQVVKEQTFTPVAATLEFKGSTATEVLVTGVGYDKADASQSGSATITGAELNVGTITVAAKDVTVNPDA